MELSPSHFPRFPLRPPYRRFRLTPSQRSSPQAISHGFPSVHLVIASVSLLPHGAISHGFPSVHLVVASVSLLPNGALPNLLFLTLPLRPPFRRFRIAPSQRSSPHAISHGFPSVLLVVASVSLLPHGALPKLFPTVSLPSTLSSLPYRSFPTELSPCYLFPTASRPSTLSSPHLAASPWSSPLYIYINIYLFNLFLFITTIIYLIYILFINIYICFYIHYIIKIKFRFLLKIK